MSEQAEQLVLDYLRRVADAAHGVLRADERLDFVRRLRARIEDMRAGASDPAQVRRVLARFGDPEALVRREAERLGRERGKERPEVDAAAVTADGLREEARWGATEGEATAPQAGDSDEVLTTQPIQLGGRSAAAPDPERRGEDAETPRTTHAPPPADVSSPASPQASVRTTAVASSHVPADAAVAGNPRSVRSAAPQARHRSAGPPVYEPRSPRDVGQELPSVGSRIFHSLPPEVRATLRGGIVEALGLVFAGVGGLLRPLPLWFIGAVLVGVAAGWSRLDKIIALLPPVVLAAVGPVVFAAVTAGARIATYPEALAAYGWMFFRVGAVLGAAYLATRLVAQARSNRPSRPPWIRTNPRNYR